MVYVNRRLLGQQRDKLFREALRMQLAQAGENLKALREIADVLIGEAKAGNIRAIEEIANRLDGKPAPQMHELGDGITGQIQRKVTYEIVHTVEEARQEREPNEDRPLLLDHSEIDAATNGHDDERRE